MSISPGFIVISGIKPVKDESTGGAAPIRSVLQPGILVIQGCRTDLIGAAPTIDSSLTGLILEIKMKPDEIDRRFKGFHL